MLEKMLCGGGFAVRVRCVAKRDEENAAEDEGEGRDVSEDAEEDDGEAGGGGEVRGLCVLAGERGDGHHEQGEVVNVEVEADEHGEHDGRREELRGRALRAKEPDGENAERKGESGEYGEAEGAAEAEVEEEAVEIGHPGGEDADGVACV